MKCQFQLHGSSETQPGILRGWKPAPYVTNFGMEKVVMYYFYIFTKYSGDTLVHIQCAITALMIMPLTHWANSG